MSAVAIPASPHLDFRNLMWLLAAMAFVVAPHLTRMPYWVGVFFGVVLAWRAWISWAAVHFPPRLVILALTIAATFGTYFTYGRLFGREAAVTLLVVMSALKLLEMRTQREVVLAIYLGFFLVMTNFLFSQTIPLGLYMLACVWIFIATLVGFNRVGRAALPHLLGVPPPDITFRFADFRLAPDERGAEFAPHPRLRRAVHLEPFPRVRHHRAVAQPGIGAAEG